MKQGDSIQFLEDLDISLKVIKLFFLCLFHRPLLNYSRRQKHKFGGSFIFSCTHNVHNLSFVENVALLRKKEQFCVRNHHNLTLFSQSKNNHDPNNKTTKTVAGLRQSICNHQTPQELKAA